MMTYANNPWTNGGNALAFEAWLQTGLKHLYDGALDETVPDDLLRLVDPDLEPGPRQS